MQRNLKSNHNYVWRNANLLFHTTVLLNLPFYLFILRHIFIIFPCSLTVLFIFSHNLLFASFFLFLCFNLSQPFLFPSLLFIVWNCNSYNNHPSDKVYQCFVFYSCKRREIYLDFTFSLKPQFSLFPWIHSTESLGILQNKLTKWYRMNGNNFFNGNYFLLSESFTNIKKILLGASRL